MVTFPLEMDLERIFLPPSPPPLGLESIMAITLFAETIVF